QQGKTRPKLRTRRERPHPLTHGASRLPWGRSHPTNSFIDVNDRFTDGRKPCTLDEFGFLRTPNCVGRDFIFLHGLSESLSLVLFLIRIAGVLPKPGFELTVAFE